MHKQRISKRATGLLLWRFRVPPCGSAATPTPAASNLPAEITLGAVHDLSGPTAIYGTSIQKGIDLAVKQINEQKFLGEGGTLKGVYEDAAGDPKQAMAAFHNRTADANITAILGP